MQDQDLLAELRYTEVTFARPQVCFCQKAGGLRAHLHSKWAMARAKHHYHGSFAKLFVQRPYPY